MVRWCSFVNEDGSLCDKQAMFVDSRGRAKSDPDHTLCPRHYRAYANAERARLKEEQKQ